MRIGHEWCGTVAAIGDGVDPGWLGRRVTGDTMLGCGHCRRCLSGRQHVCADRYEIGVRNGWPGALAEQVPVPVKALQALPGTVDAALGALVEPGGNALRAVRGGGARRRAAACWCSARGRSACSPPRSPPPRAPRCTCSAAAHRPSPASLGFTDVWTRETLPELPWDAVIDASNAAELPALAADLVEPGGRVVYIGISGRPSLLDTRALALKDVTAVGVLSASGGFAGTVELYASGAVDPRPLVAATVGLDEVSAVLAGERQPGWTAAPKIHVDPRLLP